jgi:hypothetical protein
MSRAWRRTSSATTWRAPAGRTWTRTPTSGSSSGFQQTAVLGIRIWIRWSKVQVLVWILLSASKNSKTNLDSYCFVTSLWLFNLEKWCKCAFKKQKNLEKNSFLLGSWRSRTNIAGSRSIGQRHWSADPDPYQNVMDPQHCNRLQQFSTQL